MQNLDKFKHLDSFSELTRNEKLMASLNVVFLGILITFTVLILIMIMTKIMTKIMSEIRSKPPKEEIDQTSAIVAAITVSLAQLLEVDSRQIKITKISRNEESLNDWQNATINKIGGNHA